VRLELVVVAEAEEVGEGGHRRNPSRRQPLVEGHLAGVGRGLTGDDHGPPEAADGGAGAGKGLDKAYRPRPINLTARGGGVLVALGKMALDQRLLPFTAPLEAALDKVRGALTTSAQRELLRLVDQLQIVGVPALPIPADVRVAVETAWFEDRPLCLHYRKVAYDPPVKRHVRIRSLVFDRQVTLLNCVDLDSGEDRQFRLERVVKAEVLDDLSDRGKADGVAASA